MLKRRLQLAGAVALGALLAAGSANAQSSAQSSGSVSADQVSRLEAQIKALQDQVTTLKGKVNKAEQAYATAPDPSTARAAVPIKTKAPPPSPIKMTWGGFLAAESVWRQRNEVADMGSLFTGIPYPFSPLFNEHEFHGSARQSRISLLVEGNIDPAEKLSGYYEMDFLGVGVASNYNQSNSWAPRLRHAYTTYDNSAWGFHFLAGQSWSLLVADQVGITPRKENIPLTIDANYLPGFNYTRNWQLRAVQDFGSVASLGISVENPATIFSATSAVAATGVAIGNPLASPALVNGQDVSWTNTGTSGFLNGVAVTLDQAPDIIAKAAFDPGWGHYEVFGLQRFFTSNVLNCGVVPCAGAGVVGSASEKTTYGTGVGGSVYLPLIPKGLEFDGRVMYGKGVGRYAAGQLPDVTIGLDGSLSPLTELTAMVGLIGHPWEGLDVYGYAGFERILSTNSFLAGGTIFGYGDPNFANTGCTTTTVGSFGGATPTTCIANNKTIASITGGFWQNIFKGSYGRLVAGAEYEYIRRESFAGVGGSVATDDNIVLTSIRYYPF
jgi:hypothetical protein